MHMGRRYGGLLAIVIFWAAMPAFACLSGLVPHSCCQGITEDCGSPAMTKSDCCIVQQSPDPILPAHVATATHLANVTAAPVVMVASVEPEVCGSCSPFAADSPPRISSATHSIL